MAGSHAPFFALKTVFSKKFSAYRDAAGEINARHGGCLSEIIRISRVLIEIISHLRLGASIQKADRHSLCNFYGFIHFAGNDQSIHITVAYRLKIGIGDCDSLLLVRRPRTYIPPRKASRSVRFQKETAARAETENR